MEERCIEIPEQYYYPYIAVETSPFDSSAAQHFPHGAIGGGASD